MTQQNESRPRYRGLTRKHLDQIPQIESLDREHRTALQAVSAVLPFKTNRYVVDELIDWNRVPDDPIYQLTFPQPGMLSSKDYRQIEELILSDAPADDMKAAARRIQMRLNPHPAGQMELNVPEHDGTRLSGSQHKYRETMLFFPAQGQTCHAYCTYCFRWAQFVGVDSLKFANKEADALVGYVRAHPELTDVLFTGGDPLIMTTKILRRYVEPLLADDLEHLTTVRLGSKSPAYWPQRFVTDPDADDLLRLFEEVVASGRQLALMAHFSHPRELSTPIAQEALRRIRSTGAVVRCQAPLIRHVNDDPSVWAEMWTEQVRQGLVPYYMFVERDTGAKHYFEVPLLRALEIFNTAYGRVSGVARTVRGPSMSATPGKVLVDGILEIGGEKIFILKMIQGRDPAWVGRTFAARLDPAATWLDQLEPAFDDSEFFFEARLRDLREGRWQPDWKTQGEETDIAEAV